MAGELPDGNRDLMAAMARNQGMPHTFSDKAKGVLGMAEFSGSRSASLDVAGGCGLL